MKTCPQCHEQHDDDKLFCTHCGTRLPDSEPVINIPHPTTPTTPTQAPPRPADPATQPATQPGAKRSSWRKTVLIALAAVAFIAYGVYNYATNAATYLRAEPNRLVAPKCGGEATVDIDYDGYLWSINHAPEWVKIDKNKRNFKITCEPNTTGFARNGSITIQSGDLLEQVLVGQNAVATKITASENSISFSKDGGTKTIKVLTDGTKWNVNYPNYLNVNAHGDELEVTAAPNDGDFRSGFLIISEDQVSTRVAFSQGGLCSNCHGEGSFTCTACYGNGTVAYGMYTSPCYACGGTGKLECGACGGTGEHN